MPGAEQIGAICDWTETEDSVWETLCGQAHCFFDGTPSDNSYVFCPYCGRPLLEHSFDDEVEA